MVFSRKAEFRVFGAIWRALRPRATSCPRSRVARNRPVSRVSVISYGIVLDFLASAWYRMVPFRELRVWRVEQPAVSRGIAGDFFYIRSFFYVSTVSKRAFSGIIPNFPRGVAKQGVNGQKSFFARWYGNLGIIRERENFLTFFELVLHF